MTYSEAKGIVSACIKEHEENDRPIVKMIIIGLRSICYRCWVGRIIVLPVYVHETTTRKKNGEIHITVHYISQLTL